MPPASEKGRSSGRGAKQRVATCLAQENLAISQKRRSSSPHPNTYQALGYNCEEARQPCFSNDASSVGDTSDKNNGCPESRGEHSADLGLNLDEILDTGGLEKDATRTRKKYPDLRDPSTYGKENCRVALTALGHRNVARRVKAKGKDGRRMLQEFVLDEWRLKPEMRRASMRAVAAYESMEYETSDSEEEEDAREEDDVPVGSRVPPFFAVKKLAGLVKLKGEEEATKSTYMYAFGQKYFTADVLQLMIPSMLGTGREAASKSPQRKSSWGTKKMMANTQANNGVVRLLNCLFLDNTRKYWEACKLQATRTQLDNQEVGGRLAFWSYVRDMVMDPNTKIGPLLREPVGYNLLDGLDPGILDLPASTTGAHLKEMYQRQRCDYDAAKAKVDRNGNNDNQFANLVGSAGAWYLYLWLEECPIMGGFCAAIVGHTIVEHYVGNDTDNTATALASNPERYSSPLTKKAKTTPVAAVENLGKGLCSGFANQGGGSAAMTCVPTPPQAPVRSENEAIEIAWMRASIHAMTLDNIEKKHAMLQKLWDLSDSIQDRISQACDGRKEARLAQRLRVVEEQIRELSGSA